MKPIQNVEKELAVWKRNSSLAETILAVALVYFGWLIFYSATINVLDWSATWAVYSVEQWTRAGLLLYMVLIIAEILLILSRIPRPRRQSAAQSRAGVVAMPEAGCATTAYAAKSGRPNEISPLPEKYVQSKTLTPNEHVPVVHAYPWDVIGGVYSADYIPIDETQVLKLNSELVRPCALCEHRSECYKRYNGKLTKIEFFQNVDCTAGLEALARGSYWRDTTVWENT